MEILNGKDPRELAMQRIKESKSKARSERDEKIENILSQINTQERRDAGYKDMTVPQMLGRVKQAFGSADKGVLYLLEKKCGEFDSFSKGFYYFTKKK